MASRKVALKKLQEVNNWHIRKGQTVDADVLCSYESMHYDGDFKIGDSVEVLITRLNMKKKLVYGKILRKVR